MINKAHGSNDVANAIGLGSSCKCGGYWRNRSYQPMGVTCWCGWYGFFAPIPVPGSFNS